MPKKRILLLLDGTWNDADVGPYDTNIVRLRDLIARHLGVAADTVPVDPGHARAATRKLVRGFHSAAGLEQIVFYERGVGTSWGDVLKGGIAGDGLAGNVRRAYKFLSFHYREGDEVFVFGFSRGAFTARSLVGYVADAGLLTAAACTPALEAAAWHFYRTAPNDRLPGVWTALAPHVHDRAKLRIDCVGVFETVGALGVPLQSLWRFNRDRYAFHDVDLSSITNLNLHAVAIDEPRDWFQATLWRKPPFKQFATRTEQVWFPGSHSDVGGGYIVEATRAVEHPRALDDIALHWMIQRVHHFFPDFPCDPDWKPVAAEWARAPQHDPWRLVPHRKAHRSIANCPVIPIGRWTEIEVGRDRHAEPIAEMVHLSAIERLGAIVEVDARGGHYRPPNLLSVLARIEQTYAGAGPPADPAIRLVGWAGDDLKPERSGDRAAALAAIARARQRLQGAGAITG